MLIRNSVVGPHVSLGDNSRVENSLVSNAIIQTNTKIVGGHIKNSMLGNFVEVNGEAKEYSVGDYTNC